MAQHSNVKVTPEAAAPFKVVVDDAGFTAALTQAYEDSGLKNAITFTQFIDFLPHNPRAQIEHLDSSRPFNDFFISSSHNTYLVGGQLRGKASVDGYKNALLRGCRCLEIDVWNGDNGEPKVVHGWTLVDPIPFTDVCREIASFAFTASPWPVLLSLETHCDQDQQRKMAQIMIEQFGNFLLDKPFDPLSRHLPSLQQLERKILVITENTPDAEPNDNDNDSDNDSVPDSNDSDEDERQVKANESDFPVASTNVTKVHPEKLNSELSNLGIYAVPRPFYSLSHKFSLEFNHIHNVSERMFAKLNNQSPASSEEDNNNYNKEQKENRTLTPRGLITHNNKYLMRVYPNGYRFNSSNPLPPKYWAFGVQIVALNWQRIDKSNMINQALFEGSGGFVAKPKSVTLEYDDADDKENGLKLGSSAAYRLHYKLDKVTERIKSRLHFHGHPEEAGEQASSAVSVIKRKGTIRFTIIAVQNLPLPPGEEDNIKLSDFRPYAKVQLIEAAVADKHLDKPGVPATDKIVREHTKRTKSVTGTCSPVFNQSWTWPVTTDLAFLRVKFFNNEGLLGKNSPCAWWSVRVGNHKTGYSIAHLYAMSNGSELDPSTAMLVEFNWV
ncbi:PLC-like phosphodiesterase [Lipomyces japonicus]|uniref:PLC-like phosphodiesterase n=1 Tax=Lipomyces japonicus TaxID=56871 RepID=UPI0034CF5CC7